MPTWDPKQYLTFAQERTQPAIDLVQRIPLAEAARIIDIGCGPGNSTQVLVQRYPKATVIGLDSSAEMIARARADFPAMEWRHEDAAAFAETEVYDIVFSNAVFQWIPNHEDLVPRLMGAVRPGGVFAFQIPGNHDSPLHQSLLQVAKRTEWATYLSGNPLAPGLRRPAVLLRSAVAAGREDRSVGDDLLPHARLPSGLDRVVPRDRDAAVSGEAAGRGGAGAVRAGGAGRLPGGLSRARGRARAVSVPEVVLRGGESIAPCDVAPGTGLPRGAPARKGVLPRVV